MAGVGAEEMRREDGHGVPKLNLVVIRSRAIEQAAAFQARLGLVFSVQSHGTGPTHYTAILGEIVFEIYPLREGLARTTSVRLGFLVDDLDDLLSSLDEVGAIVVERPHDSEWGRSAVIKDPDGHTVELTSRRP
jgi:catechol 2,3-dioxygenase-like lactoylglutathione lyase family enzyme